jgi:hypothetical protein
VTFSGGLRKTMKILVKKDHSVIAKRCASSNHYSTFGYTEFVFIHAWQVPASKFDPET